MSAFSDLVTRRMALRIAAAGIGAMALAPYAFAGPGMRIPMRIACMRVGPTGFLSIRHDEQGYWSKLQMQLGGLVERMTPVQPADMLGQNLPVVEGGAGCAMVARQAAARWGFSHVILYATHDGQAPQRQSGPWWDDLFAAMSSPFVKDGRAIGEAHLLDIDGGPPVVSASAEAPPRDPLNLFDGGRNPERETLAKLADSLGRSLQELARSAYENQRSIAD